MTSIFHEIFFATEIEYCLLKSCGETALYILEIWGEILK